MKRINAGKASHGRYVVAYRCERELRDGLEDGMIPQKESGKCAEAELEAWGEGMP